MKFVKVGDKVTAKQDLIDPKGYGPFTVSKLCLHRWSEKTGLYQVELKEDPTVPKRRYLNTVFEI